MSNEHKHMLKFDTSEFVLNRLYTMFSEYEVPFSGFLVKVTPDYIVLKNKDEYRTITVDVAIGHRCTFREECLHLSND